MELGARLRAFAGFVRRGSFSGAAEELRISQPAVSKHIADMERDLGVKLIERRSRAWTAAGEFLASHVWRRRIARTGPGLPLSLGVGHSRHLPAARCHSQIPAGASGSARQFRTR